MSFSLIFPPFFFFFPFSLFYFISTMIFSLFKSFFLPFSPVLFSFIPLYVDPHQIFLNTVRHINILDFSQWKLPIKVTLIIHFQRCCWVFFCVWVSRTTRKPICRQKVPLKTAWVRETHQRRITHPLSGDSCCLLALLVPRSLCLLRAFVFPRCDVRATQQELRATRGDGVPGPRSRRA